MGVMVGPREEENLAAVMVVVAVQLFVCISGYHTKLPVAHMVWMEDEFTSFGSFEGNGRDLTSGYMSAPTRWD
jgi:hypothetical protein